MQVKNIREHTMSLAEIKEILAMHIIAYVDHNIEVEDITISFNYKTDRDGSLPDFPNRHLYEAVITVVKHGEETK